MLLGIISDTHGYLNPQVPELLQGVEHILHAGDIGDPGIIDELSNIAPYWWVCLWRGLAFPTILPRMLVLQEPK